MNEIILIIKKKSQKLQIICIHRNRNSLYFIFLDHLTIFRIVKQLLRESVIFVNII